MVISMWRLIAIFRSLISEDQQSRALRSKFGFYIYVGSRKDCAIKLKRDERRLEMLNSCNALLQQHISELQVCIDRDSRSVPFTSIKEMPIKQIESKPQNASSIICKMHEQVPLEERPKSGVIGIVALLGTIQTIELSRMLAQYIGEYQMLAVVCTNYGLTKYLEGNAIPEFADADAPGKLLSWRAGSSLKDNVMIHMPAFMREDEVLKAMCLFEDGKWNMQTSS